MFTGLSAFPLTPLRDDAVDERSFAVIIERLAGSGVDSITALGSTGSYAYLSAKERARVARLAVKHAAGTPVFVGVGSLRTSDVLAHVHAAEDAGAHGVLLAPISYQQLTSDDVFHLFRTVTERASVPVIVYDNPATTHFTFTLDLYRRIAQLPGIASLKIPPVPVDQKQARDSVRKIRDVIPPHVSIGVSGDASAATGLIAGCDAWYSVIGGTLPAIALPIVRAVRHGLPEVATAESARLAPLWDLFGEFGGSVRVVAAIAEHLGFAERSCLPLPLQGLNDGQRRRLAAVVDELGLAADLEI